MRRRAPESPILPAMDQRPASDRGRAGPTWRRRVYEWVEVVPHADRGNGAGPLPSTPAAGAAAGAAPATAGPRFDWFDVAMLALILVNVAAVMWETVPGVMAEHGRALYAIEAASIAVFTLEYLLRLWACVEDPKYARRGPVIGRLRSALSPMAIIDLMAIAPFYLHLLLPAGAADLRFILSLRLLRMLRVLKIGRYSRALATLGRVIKGKREDLAVMGVVLSVVLVIAAGLMYYAEHEAQREKGNFTSIPDSLWWAVITLTTIGYGDVYPVTPLGRLLGGIIAVCGIGFVALPTAIVSAGFAEEIAKRKKAAETPSSALAAAAPPPAACPHCGKEIRAKDEGAREKDEPAGPVSAG